MDQMKEARQVRRARERQEAKARRHNADALWGRPLTASGADLLARRVGYRFAGFLGPDVCPPELRDALDGVYSPDGPRWLAMFTPFPDDGGMVILADGRSAARALRRGLASCQYAHGGDMDESWQP